MGQTKLDGRSDLYALGLMLFELVTLKRAVPGKGTRELILAARAGERNPVEHRVAQQKIPRELVAIIDKATMNAPEDRYPSVAAFADDIRRYLDGEAVHAAPDTPLQRIARWLSNHHETTLRILLLLLAFLFSTVTASFLIHLHTLEEAQHREDTISGLLTSVSRQAHHIDTHFLRYEGLLQGLGAAAEQALRQDAPAQPFYLAADFADPARAPFDVVASARYQKQISLDWTVFKLAPGLSLDTPLDPARAREAAVPAAPAETPGGLLPAQDAPPAGPTIRSRLWQLSPLRQHFKHMMLLSRGPEAGVLSAAESRAHVLEVGVPLIWSYVALEEGIHNSYPGKGGYPDGYDPRTRPWYQLAAHKKGPRWGNPYLDALGQGLILPCAMSLYDDQGKFLGVAGVEFTFAFLIDELLDLPGVAGVRETYLLDEQARIVVRSGEQADPDRGSDVLELSRFPLKQVALAVDQGRSGFAQSSTPSGDVLVFYTRMEALGWSYVVVGDREIILNGAQP